MEETYTNSLVSKRKRNPKGGSLADLCGLELNMTNMEIDEANNVLVWVAVQLVEIKLIVEDLS